MRIKNSLSKNQISTAKTFSYIWKHTQEYENAKKKEIKYQIKDFDRLSDGKVRKYLKTFFLKNNNKKIKFLDLGCGLGWTFSIIFKNYIKKIDYYGFDVTTNLNKTSSFLSKVFKKDNFKPKIFKFSMNKIPNKKEFKNFDFIWAQGSMHHSESVETAFKNISRIINKKGILYFWIINEQKPLRKLTDKHIREFFKKMDLKNQFAESYEIAKLASAFGNQLKDKKFKITRPIKSLGIERGNYRLQEILYDYVIKFFYNKDVSLKRNSRHHVFDWFSPEYYHQTKKNSLLKFLKKTKFKIIHYKEMTHGHSVIAEKI